MKLAHGHGFICLNVNFMQTYIKRTYLLIVTKVCAEIVTGRF